MRRTLFLLSLVTWLGVSGTGVAQDEESDEPEATDEAAEDTELSVSEDADSTAPADATAAAESGKAPTWWVGPFVGGVVVPAFMLELFLDASPTVFNVAVGATVTHRDADGHSWILGLGYTGYGFDGPFRISGDPVQDTEYLNSSLGLLHLRGQIMWSANLSETLDFEYGVGIDLGVVLGKMVRNEAFQNAGGDFQPCAGALDPRGGAFCEAPTNPPFGSMSNTYDMEGAHYNVKEDRVPPIAGSLMLPALALRYAPIRQLAIKLEASFGLLQFSFGLSAAYGIDS